MEVHHKDKIGKIIFKNFIIKKKIGEGSYGVVYRAFDTKDNNKLVF